jgi:hypothetical protein
MAAPMPWVPPVTSTRWRSNSCGSEKKAIGRDIVPRDWT